MNWKLGKIKGNLGIKHEQQKVYKKRFNKSKIEVSAGKEMWCKSNINIYKEIEIYKWEIQ